ncbi:MAG: MATE family efflux transporter [Firmicutes bacterium]|nr:MATE family efflux transporter [Bacillota bacterium]
MEAQRDKNFLGNEPIRGLFWRLSMPAVVAQLVNLLYNMVDRVYIGRYDATGLSLTGIGVCMPVIMMVSAFACLVGMGGAPRASILMGQKRNGQAERTMGNCFSMLVVLSLSLTVILLMFSEKILFAFGASEKTIVPAMEYLNLYLLGTLSVQISLGMNTFISAQGFTKTSMLSVLIGAVINIILDPVFIFLFDMGVKGAAVATVIAQSVSSVWILFFLFGKKTVLRIQRKNIPMKLSVIMPCVTLGISPFIMQFTESVLGVCFNTSLLKYGGDIAVGSMTILMTLSQFCLLPLNGLTQGAQPITSYNFGAGNEKRVRESFKILLKSCLIYASAIWILVMMFPKVFVQLFNSGNPQLIDYTAWALRIYAAVLVLMGIQIACQQTFIAIGNAKTSFFLACLRKLILLIPLIYILPQFFERKDFAVFLAEPVADFLAVSATVFLFRKQFGAALKKLSADSEESSKEEYA